MPQLASPSSRAAGSSAVRRAASAPAQSARCPANRAPSSALLSRSSAALCLALGLSACGSDEESPTGSARDFAPVDAAIEQFLTDQGLEGASVVVVERDEGIVHLAALGSFEPGRVSLIASASKVMSAGVLLHLEDAGLVDLDAPISEYMAAFGEHKTDITLAQMLSNSSGMVGLLDDPTYGPYICQYLGAGTLTECGEKIYTADDVADRVPPDTAFRYGGGQWQLAGAVAEVASGKPWAQLVDEIYAKPCDLTSTGYRNHFSQAFLGGGVDSALTYPDFFQADLANLSATDNPNIEGGAYTTALDYGKFLWMHLRGGECNGQRVLSESATARMQADRVGEVYGGSSIDPSLPGYGFGWWVSREEPLVADPGAYGASPWLDNARGYAAIVILEGEAVQGVQLREALRPLFDELFPLPAD